MKRLELLDYARLIAAVAVMAFHYLFNGINGGKVGSIAINEQVAAVAKYGYLGVELFFIISGYVIFFSAKSRSAGEFFVSRASRLVPAYIPAVLLTALVAQRWGGETMAVTWPQVLANFTFFPNIFGFKAVDGVYWTLRLEIIFYALVFIILAAGQQRRLGVFFLAWPFLMLLALVVNVSEIPLLGGYFAFFAAGALLAMRKERPALTTTAAALLAMMLCMQYAITNARALSESKGVLYSDVVVAVIVGSFFLFFLILNTQRGSTLRLPGSRLAGALTYPLYLVHAHIGYMILSKFANEANKWLAYAVTAAIAFFLAYMIHVVFEKRLGRYWKRLFELISGGLKKRMSSPPVANE